jgi:eukaryotic-like serine/threonine-protein kinase
VVHRDIKPANIILLKDGTVKVGDFGVARIESSTLTQIGTVLGSPSYMSPEQFMGQTVDGRSDLYSAGVALYELLTGEVAFTGAYTTIMHKVLNEIPSPPSALNVQVPKAFDALLTRAMAKRPDERFQTADEFKQALLAVGSSNAVLAAHSGVSPAGTLLRPASALPAPPPAQSVPPPPGSGALSPRALFAVLGVLVLAVGGGAVYWWKSQMRPEASVSSAVTQPTSSTPSQPDTPITAVGVAKAGSTEQAMTNNARQQAVAKAVALYVEPASLDANYPLIQAKLLSHSDDFITSVVQQPTAQRTPDGRVVGTITANVNLREVQKALNGISREDRVEFIRNNGDPHIAVVVTVQDADAPSGSGAPSDVAANLLKERIRSFGFSVVDGANTASPPDFKVSGEVHFKRLATKLPASGVVIEKFVLTAWTINAVDTKSGQEIYHNTEVPQKQSWATQELALQDVGRLIGAEFNKNFFLQYFDFKPKAVRLKFAGLPADAAPALLLALNSSLVVLNAASASNSNGDLIVDTTLSGGAAPALTSVQHGILEPLNRKMGQNCFTLAGPDAPELSIAFDSSCTAPAILNRLGVPPSATPAPQAPSPQGGTQPNSTAGKIQT